MSNNLGRPSLFSEPKQISVIVEASVYDQLVTISRQSRLPVAELIRRSIDNYLGADEPMTSTQAAGA